MADGAMHTTMTHESGGPASGHSGHITPALALVPAEEATHRAVATGDWSDGATWADGVIPGAGAKVLIPEGVTVTVDGELAPEIKTVRADGTLAFATDVNTELKVDTLVTGYTGTLQIGTAAAPIDADVTARITFADDGPIDRDWDPGLISRGALLHGRTEIHGAQKTGFTTLAEQPAAGATSITLDTIPTGWRLGDEITIAGTDPDDPEGDEVVTITGIDGSTITFDPPLDSDHIAPRSDLDVHVANLTRNVIFESEDAGTLNRGHVMFMHTNDADLRYVSFEDLGRSNKQLGLDDWRLLSGNEGSIGAENTEVELLGGEIVRGRYSVHFHQAGSDGAPAHVEGSVVRDDPSWGFTNHSSNVDFIGNVTHNVIGSGYVTEAGDEVGSFIGNIAIRTVNPDANLNPADAEIDPGQAPDARAETQDYGWQGDGFWFHGSGVTVDDNVVSGATGHAYIYWQLGLVERATGEKLVDVADLPNGDLIGPDGTLVRTKQVPVPSFDGNEAYVVPKGLQIHYLHTDNRDDQDVELVADGQLAEVPQAYEDQLQSTFSDATFWNVSLSGVDAPYATRLTFEDIDVFGTGAPSSYGIKLNHFANQNNFTVRDVTVEGFDTGIAAPRQGDATVERADFANATDLLINLPDQDPRTLEIVDLNFLPLPAGFETVDETRQNVRLDPAGDFAFGGGLFEEFEDFEEDSEDAIFTVAFLGDSITVGGYSFVETVADELGPQLAALNFGVGGSGLTEAAFPYQETEAAEELLDSDADLVWIMIGGNDLAGGADVEDYEEALFGAVEMLTMMPSDPQIIIAAQPPFFAVGEGEFDGIDGAEAHETFREAWIPAMERVADEFGALFVDINAAVDDYPENYPDLIHPDAAGAGTLAELIAPIIEEALPEEVFEEDEPDDDEPEEEEDGDAFEDDEDADEDFDEAPEGYPPLLLPDRITLDLDGAGPGDPVGLYFDIQAPDFVPFPEGSELATFIGPDVVGLTNAELQDLYGISVADALTPMDAAPADFLDGGVTGTPLAQVVPFPPGLDPRFAFVGEGEDEDDFDDEDELEDEDRGDAGDLEDGPILPDLDVALLYQIAKLYIVFFGRLPDASGFTFWADTLAANPDMDMGVLGRAFAGASEFETLFGNASPAETVTGLYRNVLDRDPEPEGLAHWSQALETRGDFGVVDLGMAFVNAPETHAMHGGAIRAHLGIEDMPLFATDGADVFLFPEDGFTVVEGFDPGADTVDARAQALEIEIIAENGGSLLIAGEAELFLADVAPDLAADSLLF